MTGTLPQPSSSTNLPEISRPKLASYPRNVGGRSFSATWYSSYEWLEYDEEKDACLCYPCRVYESNQKEKTFTVTGFRNWKNALTSNKGFKRHDISEIHVKARQQWMERTRRDQSDTAICSLLTKPDPEHRTWLFTVFSVIKYLVMNGLPLRGDVESTDFEDLSGGLFLSTIGDLLFKMDPGLQEIAKRLPENAKYTSPDIQNDVIEVLADMVKRQISESCIKSGVYTVMMDGTEDGNGTEMEAVVLRYWDVDAVAEHVIAMEPAQDRTAEGLMKILTNVFEDYDISFDGLASDCFDGASVNSGWKGGIQAILTKKCGRFILYIHCINHRLHLVVKKILVKKVDKDGNDVETDDVRIEVQDFFELVGGLYTFFQLNAVKELYSGRYTLKRLITTRWSGHLNAVKVIKECYHEILQALEAATTEKKLKPEQRVKAKGHLAQLKDSTNMLLLHFMYDILVHLDMLTASFQSGTSTLSTSLEILGVVKEKLVKSKDKYSVGHIAALINAEAQIQSEDPRPKRKKTMPGYLSSSVVTMRMPVYHKPSGLEELKALADDVINCFVHELDNRFSDENTSLWESFKILLPTSDKENFLDTEKLKPLLDYCLSIPHFSYLLARYGDFNGIYRRLQAEHVIFKDILLNKFGKRKDGATLKDGDVLTDMYRYCHCQETTPVISSLLKVAIVAGYSTSTVENAFSARNRVDTDRRRRLTPYKQGNLSLLHFEKQILSAIDFESFLKIWKEKPRRLKV